jgi:hypothetical protein
MPYNFLAESDIEEAAIEWHVATKNSGLSTSISAPAGTVSVKCHIATGGYHLKNGGEACRCGQ